MTEQRAMRFTEDGREAFQKIVNAYRDDPTRPSPNTLVSDIRYCEELLGTSVAVERRPFGSRFEFAEYLYDKFGHRWESGFVLDAGLMEWLTAFYFAELTTDGEIVKLGELARYVVTESYSKAYRHLVAGPLWSYSLCKSTYSARMLLSTALHSPGDLYEQLASRQEIHTNPSVIEVASRLYFDVSHGRVKRGAVTASRLGNLRRFIAVNQQLDLTYDIYSMSADDIAALLPAEFEDWLGSTG